VNRVSLGLQALDDATLRFLGRAHDVNEALSALAIAQRVFARVSFDLIYARPEQRPEDWERELTRAIEFGTEHLSLYQLTIEPGTRFETLVREGTLTPLGADAAADLYEATQAMTSAAGLPAYEVSNHARQGAESRHNLTYWRYGDYLGIGPGAHGRRGGVATVRHRKPENWMNAVARNANGIASEDALSPAEQAREALVMGLRLAEGVDTARDGIGASAIDWGKAERLAAQDLLVRTGNRIAVTPAGMLLLDRILAEIVSA
jgi:oxygen-independent coproporphyrinogen-3 oxidase